MKIPVNEVKAIGIAIPGPFDYVNGICLIKGVAKYENLYGFNIADAYGLFGNNLEASLINERCRCKVEVSELKQDAALLGSAYLFDDKFWKAIQHALPLM